MAGFRHVVFDVDGTLADTNGISLRALQDLVFEETGEEEDLEDLALACGIPGKVALERLGIRRPGALERWDQIIEARGEKAEVFPGVRSLLLALKGAGHQVGVVTSRRRDEYESAIVPLGLEECVDERVFAEDAPEPKPSPAPLLTYLGRTGARPEETIYIGDSEYDARCARDAGVTFAFAGWSGEKPVEDASFWASEPGDIFLIAEWALT